jgi:uncharacterized protein (DUF2062 family)
MKKPFSLFRAIRYLYLRLIRLRGDPYTLARSCSFGVFVGIIPLMPIQTIILIPLTIAFGFNTIATLVAAAVVSNPLTYILQYFICWWVGNLVLPDRVNWEQIKNLLENLSQQGFMESLAMISNLGFHTISVLLVGGIILGLLLAPLGYWITLPFFIRLQAARIKRRRLD